jgi:hypothetical protein
MEARVTEGGEDVGEVLGVLSETPVLSEPRESDEPI